MTAFPKEHLDVFTGRRAARRAALANPQPGLQGLVTLETLVCANKVSASQDAGTYRELFGEPLPHHAQHALDTEYRMLERLEEGIAVFLVSDPTSDDIEKYRASVRSYLTCLSDVLRAEEELLTNCLSLHYLDVVDRIYARSEQVRL